MTPVPPGPYFCRECSKEKSQMTNKLSMPRRAFCGGLAASAGLLATSPFSEAFAQNYPGRKISVVIPTGQGGGAERLARAFDDAWGKILKTQFEYNFFPGASGPDRLRAVRQAAPEGRAQSAVRQHGSGNDHVYDPEAGLQFPARLHLFLDGRHRRQHRLREPHVAVQVDRAGRRRREEAPAQRRGEPDPASLLDRSAGARRGDQVALQPRPLWRRQPDLHRRSSTAKPTSARCR